MLSERHRGSYISYIDTWHVHVSTRMRYHVIRQHVHVMHHSLMCAQHASLIHAHISHDIDAYVHMPFPFVHLTIHSWASPSPMRIVQSSPYVVCVCCVCVGWTTRRERAGTSTWGMEHEYTHTHECCTLCVRVAQLDSQAVPIVSRLCRVCVPRVCV